MVVACVLGMGVEEFIEWRLRVLVGRLAVVALCWLLRPCSVV